MSPNLHVGGVALGEHANSVLFRNQPCEGSVVLLYNVDLNFVLFAIHPNGHNIVLTQLIADINLTHSHR